MPKIECGTTDASHLPHATLVTWRKWRHGVVTKKYFTFYVFLKKVEEEEEVVKMRKSLLVRAKRSKAVEISALRSQSTTLKQHARNAVAR